MLTALPSVLSAIHAARQVLRANRTPGTPPGDKDEQHEDNTYNLPEGRPIRRAFKRFAKRQLKKILASVPEIGAPLPASFPSLADWTDPMASAMTPLVGLYWDEGGQTTRARLGLDPDAWEVHDPNLHRMIQQQALRFCESTNATTDLELGEALAKLREELTAGLVDEGDTVYELTERVKSVFTRMSTWKAEQIGRTEAARAVHAASLQSAKESGVVTGKKWLLSADACEYCHEAAAKFPGGAGLDQEFDHRGNNPDYASCQMPPLHPNCRCSITYVLTDEYEQLLKEHGPPEPEKFDYDGGSLAADPKQAKKVPTAKQIVARQPILPVPVHTYLPIEERIQKAEGVQKKLERMTRVQAGINRAKSARRKAEKAIVEFIAANPEVHLTDSPDRKKLLELETIYATHVDRIGELQRKARTQVDKILDLPKSHREQWKHADGIGSWRPSDHIYIARDRSTKWLEAKVAAGRTDGPTEITWNTKPQIRPYAVKAHKSIFAATSEQESVLAHEQAHHIEFYSPGAERAAQEFLKYRVKGEVPQKLQTVLPNHKYEDWEHGRQDEFAKAFGSADAWYVGKYYPAGHTEIISMGVQKLYEDPLEFATKDPEYCAFILGILDGTLRSP